MTDTSGMTALERRLKKIKPADDEPAARRPPEPSTRVEKPPASTVRRSFALTPEVNDAFTAAIEAIYHRHHGRYLKRDIAGAIIRVGLSREGDIGDLLPDMGDTTPKT